MRRCRDVVAALTALSLCVGTSSPAAEEMIAIQWSAIHSDQLDRVQAIFPSPDGRLVVVGYEVSPILQVVDTQRATSIATITLPRSIDNTDGGVTKDAKSFLAVADGQLTSWSLETGKKNEPDVKLPVLAAVTPRFKRLYQARWWPDHYQVCVEHSKLVVVDPVASEVLIADLDRLSKVNRYPISDSVLVYRPRPGNSTSCGDWRSCWNQASGLRARCKAVSTMVERELCA